MSAPKTELSKRILQSPEANELYHGLAPVYGDAQVMLWLLQALGSRLDLTRGWCEELALQVIPQTAGWTIGEWEREYGIHHDPALTIEQRREAVVSTVNQRPPMNPHKLARLAAANAGISSARVVEHVAPHTFSVFLSSQPHWVDEAKVRAAIDLVKPAQEIYTIEYEQGVDLSIRLGVLLTIGKQFTVRMV